jgi:sporulation protein YlmC with PRC-barrel domain
MSLYTKNGRPLQVSGNTVYSRSGKVVGRISGDKVYGTDGRYVGTIVGDRLVKRSTDSAGISSPFVAINRVGSATINSVGSAMWGDEPDIPD